MMVQIGGLELLRAIACWRDSSGIGCEFVRPLSRYVFEHLARLASAPSQHA